MKNNRDELITWRCVECHEIDIHGGITQTSKTRGKAGRCYWCNKPVDVYFGKNKRIL
jgi:hypothetical protein